MLDGLFNYWVAILLMMIGLYGVLAKRNMVKQAIALGLFQTGVFLFYISMGVKAGGTAPVWTHTADHSAVKHIYGKDAMGENRYVAIDSTNPPTDNPLNHILILTAIVVSVSTLAVALAIIVNIQRAYGTVEEDDILELDAAEAA